MKKYLYLAYDLFCIGLALIVALYLRHGFPLIQEGQPEDLYLLLAVVTGTALMVLPLMRTHTSMWRYTSASEITSIMIAVALVALIYNSTLFLTSRLEMMPRSVPPMHWAIAVCFMVGSRLIIRQLLGPSRGARKTQTALKQHVIVVGTGHTAELYLQFIKRIVQHQVIIEGFVDSNEALTGRVFQKHEILGTPLQLPELLEQLHVHGVHVKHLVLTQMLNELPVAEQELILQMKQQGMIEIIHFAKHMAPQAEHVITPSSNDFYHSVAALASTRYEEPKGFYPYLKRLIDVLGGIVLLIVCLPLLLFTAVLVALDVGFPILFWQQRPGRHGKPFRLYKFRTMRKAGRKFSEDRLTHKSSDEMRMSYIGRWLRRLRWDELPQLFHIIIGTMSFVGPRPLLPEDQPEGGELRLSLRPGVTGWAQIHGGDALTPQEKLVLDSWYIRHMSLWLDIRIVLRTLLAVLVGDKPSRHVMNALRKDVAA
jgi:lipopolysaccharide/colanic/teichoic acid biosynthesis glycosyltransferase